MTTYNVDEIIEKERRRAKENVGSNENEPTVKSRGITLHLEVNDVISINVDLPEQMGLGSFFDALEPLKQFSGQVRFTKKTPDKDDATEPQPIKPQPTKQPTKSKQDIVSRVRHNMKWTKNEVEQLVDLYNNKDYSFGRIAKILERTEAAVKYKYYEVGGDKQQKYPNKGKEWSKHEDNFIIANWDRMSYKDIGDVLGRTPKSVEVRYYGTLNKQ